VSARQMVSTSTGPPGWTGIASLLTGSAINACRATEHELHAAECVRPWHEPPLHACWCAQVPSELSAQHPKWLMIGTLPLDYAVNCMEGRESDGS